jgi:type VI secretion system protein ImpF
VSRPGAEQKLVLSVLDRMLDDEPKTAAEARETPSRNLARLKESVKRDLEWLLNAKRLMAELPADLRQVGQSLLTYGLPDFTTSSLSSSHDQARLLRAIEETIERFEPRLAQVKVVLEPAREFDRTVRFRIDALLKVEPEPEPVTFDSVLQLSTKAFVVQGR